MKKIIITIIVLIILALGGFLIYKNYFDKPEPPKVKNETKTLHGIVYDASMNTVLVKDSKGLIYLFSIMDVDRSNIENLTIGNLVSINYKGKLTNNNELQTVKIKNIAIKESEDNKVPKAWNDLGVFSDYYQEAYDKLKTLSLDEKIGQLFLVRVPENNQIQAIKDYNLGGYILFGRDTKNETKESLSRKIKTYQDAAKTPMIIATDEEGGTVVRVSSNPNLRSQKFPSPQQQYQQGGMNKVKETTKEMSQLLSSLGINVNLAPVADVSTNRDDFIYDRSFGKDANETSDFIKTVISSSKGGNVSYVLKHFPGYGNNKDTHTGISIDNRTLESFKNNDFLPFEAGIKEGAEATLVSHNIISKVEENTPASLSLTIHNILRGDLKFTGITMTDDLDMDAIKKYIDGSSAVKSILAGNDMVIVSNYTSAYNEIKKALDDKTITEELLDHNVFRILAWKYYKGML